MIQAPKRAPARALTRAMVLAAGLGLRLRPLTEDRPKPLVAVAGRTMLDRALDALGLAGVEDCVVNTHYLADMIARHVAARTRPRIELSFEETLLDTGGGLARALPRLGTEPFFSVNADILWEDGAEAPALARLAAAFDPERMDALLLVVPIKHALGYDGAGDFFLTPDKRLTRRGQLDAPAYVYTGLQILHPRLFAGAPEGPFSLNRLYDQAIIARRLFGLVHDARWFHVGTTAALAQAEAALAAPLPPASA